MTEQHHPYQPGEFLGPSQTKDYLPEAYGSYWSSLARVPLFTLARVNEMLADPRIGFGLWLIKGPILALSRFYIDCKNQEVKEFLKKTVTRFWRNCAGRALKAIEWGYSASEASYRVRDGKICFDTLKDLHPLDAKALTRDGDFIGFRLRNTKGGHSTGQKTIAHPRSFWHVHDRLHHPFYGKSRLYGAFLPWIEIFTDGGFRDTRRLFFYKYAYDGGVIYHPNGVYRSEDGNMVIPYKDLARELLEKKKTGGILTLPNVIDETGKRAWEHIPPTVQPAPTSLMEYGDNLRDEEWEGMGIPPEIARAEGTGAYAGRRVPQQAFYATLQDILFWLNFDADQQIYRPLVEVNYGQVEYEIVPFGLLEPTPEESDQGGSPYPAFPEARSADQDQGAQMSHYLRKQSNQIYLPGEVCVDFDPRKYSGEEWLEFSTSVKDKTGHLHGAKGGKNPGQFVSSPDSGKDDTKGKKGKFDIEVKSKGGKWQLPKLKHLKQHKFPAPSENVTRLQVSSSPKANFHARHMDSKGRWQQGGYYNPEYKQKQDQHKFTRVHELLTKRDKIVGQIQGYMNDKDPATSAAGAVLYMLNVMGLRPGHGGDTKASHKSFGVRTLQASHVKIGAGGNVYLRFVPGKSHGQEKSFPVEDPVLANLLKRRKNEVGPRDRLFDVSMSRVTQLGKSLDGGKFKVKDFRTAMANQIAQKLVGDRKRLPKNLKQYKAFTKEVGQAVSKKLGNTWTVALKHYVDPSLFHAWKEAAGVD